MRMTHTLVQVAIALMERPEDAQWGYELGQRSDVKSGTLYTTLNRLRDRGWLSDVWEDIGAAAGRPPRRFYKITPVGLTELNAVLDRASRDQRFTDLDFGPLLARQLWKAPPVTLSGEAHG